MLDIPRDTCWQGDKINAANTHGARASADAVSGLIGVPVSYVVQVNFAGFTNLVDGVGGVDVNVKTQMHDAFSGAFFSPGVHHMTGDEALRFSRDRHDFPNSDITRTNNQGSLILDAMRMLGKQMQSAGGEFKLLALLGPPRRARRHRHQGPVPARPARVRAEPRPDQEHHDPDHERQLPRPRRRCRLALRRLRRRRRRRRVTETTGSRRGGSVLSG